MTVTLLSAWTAARRALETAGVDSPVLDARALLEAAAGVARIEILTDPYRALSTDQIDRLNTLVARRAGREPLSHILGEKGFWKLTLAVNQDVLTPRPETEYVVEAALSSLSTDAAARVLDIGTGSGAIVCAILSERPMAIGVGLDVSAAALAVAALNRSRCGLEERLELRRSDWTAEIEEQFDVIVSNPPYIPTAEIDLLEPEVSRYEPRLALDGGADGLDAYRALIPEVFRLLRPGGTFAVEVGKAQDGPVSELARAAGLEVERVCADLAGIGRVVTGRRPL